MVEIQVVEHQKVVVAVLVVHPLAPCLSFALDEVDAFLTVGGIEVGAREVVPVPFESGIAVAASGKVESRAPFDFIGAAQQVFAVGGIDFAHRETLGVIGSGLVVHHRVEIDRDAAAVQLGDRLLQLRPGAVLGAHGSLLVEFAQIVEVVGRIPLVLLLVGFVGGRNPHRSHAHLPQVARIPLQAAPQGPVIG